MKHTEAIGGEGAGFGLYVHWPFCLSKCPYCDFNSHVAGGVEHGAWERAFVRDIRLWGEAVPERLLTSIYFGGGTPSLMAPETVAAVIDAARAAWRTSNEVEITLEANPTSIELGKLRDFRGAGVNRVSVGVQALEDEALRLLGRTHSAAEALRAFDVARSVFERASFDLIYARQFQGLDAWRNELTTALSLQFDHLSLYQLTVEQGTAFGDRQSRGLLRGLPDEDAGADLYFLTQELCDAAGLFAYEVSNHARSGHEGRHNLTYWRYGDYVGIGPGAHGRVSRNGQKWATSEPLSPSVWLTQSAQRECAFDRAESLSHSEMRAEWLLMGLRLSEGIDLARMAAFGVEPPEGVRMNALVDQGLLWKEGQRIGTTPEGRPLLNAILRDLV